MDTLSIIILAVGLAMDCCAVSVVQGLAAGTRDRNNRPKPALMALIFGLFHAGMPIIGFYAGSLFTDFMQRYAPWIALFILSALGIKMIWESCHEKEEAHTKDNWTVSHLLMLALATSVDVLATGVLFIPFPDKLWCSVAVIGSVTALFSIAGYLLGVFVGKLKWNMELVGGLVLIALGIKIWSESFF